MKTCPICKARCFDDMEICYGCMHRFEEGPEARNMPLEDVVGFDEVPFRPNARHAAEAEAEPPASRKGRQARKGAAPVFDEMGGCPHQPDLPGNSSDDSLGKAGSGSRDWPFAGALRFQPMAGPLAVAQLGDGYQLVVSIERV